MGWPNSVILSSSFVGLDADVFVQIFLFFVFFFFYFFLCFHISSPFSFLFFVILLFLVFLHFSLVSVCFFHGSINKVEKEIKNEYKKCEKQYKKNERLCVAVAQSGARFWQICPTSVRSAS